MTKRALLLGGTGAMGRYLDLELAAGGFHVDITTRSNRKSSHEGICYIQGDAHNLDFLNSVLNAEKYDVVVDFMVYTTDEFRSRYQFLLQNCTQYIFLSSYRVFADSKIITETSPRLLDVSNDTEYLSTADYALTKARQEDILRTSKKNNWTIVRPAITYSRERFQLGTLEADIVVWRALHNLPVALPKEMLSKYTTMTWAGDVARLISKLALNKRALGEDFNVATNEHNTWREVADIYRSLIGLKLKSTTTNKYIAALGGGHVKYQVNYDRMFDRILDNSKILGVTEESQKDFIALREGLSHELFQFAENNNFSPIDYITQAKFDKLTHSKLDLSKASEDEKNIYKQTRYPIIMKAVTLLRMHMSAKSFLRHLRNYLRIRTRLRAMKQRMRLRTRLRQAIQKGRDLHTQHKINNADGAIITLNGYYNYGNIVQRFALQEFLAQKGYNFISYAREPLDVSGPEYVRYQNTAVFLQNRILRKNFDPSERLKSYIVGSDQVWRNWGYADITSELGYFFFDFLGDSNVKRIAYAASFGQSNLEDAWITPEFIEYAKPFVEKFNAISVREGSGVDIMHEAWNATAQQVLDPTMLLSAKDYDRLIRKSPHVLSPVKPIFTYVLAVSEEKSKIIRKIATDVNLAVEGLDLEETSILPPVEQWLKSFRDAELVITDSFHGAVFSIINNTPFVVIENANGGVARITSLLKKFGIEWRLVAEIDADSVEFSKFESIDWDDVNKRLEKLRKESGDWLLDALVDESKGK